jgi:hypothetical protein
MEGVKKLQEKGQLAVGAAVKIEAAVGDKTDAPYKAGKKFLDKLIALGESSSTHQIETNSYLWSARSSVPRSAENPVFPEKLT